MTSEGQHMANPMTEYEDALIADRMATVYHSSPGELRKYLREHPNADKSKHQVSTKHKPKARPQREREYEVGRAESRLKKLKTNLEEDTKALESAKDDKEREEIQRDIDRGKKQLSEAESAVDKATKDRDSNKRTKSDVDMSDVHPTDSNYDSIKKLRQKREKETRKEASEVTAFEDALVVERIASRFAAASDKNTYKALVDSDKELERASGAAVKSAVEKAKKVLSGLKSRIKARIDELEPDRDTDPSYGAMIARSKKLLESVDKGDSASEVQSNVAAAKKWMEQNGLHK